jgi:hypothetical protein
VDCSGIGIVKGSPEEEQEFEQRRQRNREELEREKAAPATASFGKQAENNVKKVVHEASGSTKLHLACSHGEVEEVRKLLAQGSEVNAANKWGATALDLTYSNGARGPHRQIFAEIARLLRAKGGKTNSWTGETF